MQDRFKFRIFIKNEPNQKYNGMFKVHSLHLGTNKAIISSQYGNVSIKLDNKALMQSTGLKDKNGKLIYEGDIVKFGEFYEEWQYSHIGKVYWGGEYSYPAFEIQCSTYDFDTCNGLSYIFCEGLSIEVIGNIYENPELFKEDNNE